MDVITTWWRTALAVGLESNELNAFQMGIRAVVVYGALVIIVRLGKKRFMGRATPFDVILGVILGSIASRAITGNSPLIPALVATAVLVAMHWFLSDLALKWPGFGHLIKGQPRVLIRDSKIDWERLRAEHMSEHDLWEDLRRKGISKLGQVAEARLERNGELSVIRADH